MTTQPGDSGTCGFCGTGEGWLGEQGDEGSQWLHSSVRTGEAPNWEFGTHPGALKHDRQMIIWCGMCVGGLEHKYQRHDDHNLSAEYLATKFWLELDGPRWTTGWESEGEMREVSRKYKDDISIHMDKLRRQRDLEDLGNERFRRAGFDLTTRGWRP